MGRVTFWAMEPPHCQGRWRSEQPTHRRDPEEEWGWYASGWGGGRGGSDKARVERSESHKQSTASGESVEVEAGVSEGTEKGGEAVEVVGGWS